MKRILYIQYTDPAAYPPLEHSSLLLADKGWNVRHLGITASGAAKELSFPRHASIEVELRSRPSGGWRTVVHYLLFLAWCRSEIVNWNPDIVYCSDVRSYPVGLWASRNCHMLTVLHEHDPPALSGGGSAMHLLRAARRLFARRASLVIIPQRERSQTFLTCTGADPRQLHIVLNCPSQSEINDLSSLTRDERKEFVLWYHGSLGMQQIPPTVIDALVRLPDEIHLEIAGYETVGSQGYVSALRARARDLGVSDRVIIHSAFPLRAALLKAAAKADVGLALFSNQFRDPMVGASNKPFDYLACGLPLLTNRTPEWEEFFGAEGVSVGCDPEDADDIAQAVLRLRNDPEKRRRMSVTGRHLVQTRWNYEAQFAEVLSHLETAYESARRDVSRSALHNQTGGRDI